MKQICLLPLLLTWCFYFNGSAQTLPEENAVNVANQWKPKFGLKLGYNIAKLTGSAPNFSPNALNGFNVSAFYSPSTNGLGYRTELVFSRQGFSFDESGKLQNVSQDYVYMPQLTTFTIARKVQLQAGGQIGYLLNAKKETKTENNEEAQLLSYMNRIDYGATVGLEIYPFKGFIVGGRYNVSMGNPYKNPSTESSLSSVPLPLPVNPAAFKGKNAVIQFSLGYRF